MKDLEKKKRLFFWDYIVGVRKKFFVGIEGIKDLIGIFKFGENVISKYFVVVGDDGVVKVVVL